MNIKVGSIFPENSIYLYNDGIMKKTITTSLFSKKKLLLLECPEPLHRLALTSIYQVLLNKLAILKCMV